jgi:hypothetical protein
MARVNLKRLFPWQHYDHGGISEGLPTDDELRAFLAANPHRLNDVKAYLKNPLGGGNAGLYIDEKGNRIRECSPTGVYTHICEAKECQEVFSKYHVTVADFCTKTGLKAKFFFAVIHSRGWLPYEVLSKLMPYGHDGMLSLEDLL